MKRILCIVFLVFANFGKAQSSGFLDFNGYYDSRDYSVMTLNILANMPNRFQYFSLTNFEGTDANSDLGKYYSEHNLRWRIRDTSSFDLTLQYVLRQGDRNDDWRLGFRWTVTNFEPVRAFFKKINFRYSANPMLLQAREATELKFFTQIEHVYKLDIAPKLTGKRLYVAGFWDLNFSKEDSKVVYNHVTEHQIGARIYNQLYAVAEYRINTFLNQNKTGWGYGIQYKIIF